MRNTFPKRPSARWTFISATYLPEDVSFGAIVDTHGFIWTHPNSLVANVHEMASKMVEKVLESHMNNSVDDTTVITYCVGEEQPGKTRHVQNLIRQLDRIHDPLELRVALVAYGILVDRYTGDQAVMEQLKTALMALMDEDTPIVYVQA
jgi:hypothetical protein